MGYTLKNNSLSTQSGLTVGIPYETVAGMYGTVKKNMILIVINFIILMIGMMKNDIIFNQ